jgi:DNA-binding MurR/RpiR family transcriptional regulator
MGEGSDMSRAANDDFFARLAAVQSNLSPQMSRVAAFFDEHYLQAAFMPTREIAAASGVSLATVVRFPRELGYTDIGELREAIRDRVRVDLDGVEHFRSLPTTNRSAAALIRRVIETDIDSLQTLARGFSEPQFVGFIQSLLEARRVLILGFRHSRPLADYFGYSLAKILLDVQTITYGDSSVFDRLRATVDGDLIVIVAMARYPADLFDVARYAHSRGRKLLVITDTPLSPFLPLAEIALLVRPTRLDFVGSIAAPAALINCIVSEAAVRLGPQAMARLSDLEEAAIAGGTYIQGRSKSGQAPERSIAWHDEDEGNDQRALGNR